MLKQNFLLRIFSLNTTLTNTESNFRIIPDYLKVVDFIATSLGGKNTHFDQSSPE